MTAEIRIDLVSDTATRPGAEMRKAMANAEVGDEQRGEDPMTSRLCERVAALLGKEAAVFLPSGIMCNQVAIAVHCRPGDEIYSAAEAHIIGSEGAGAAIFAGSLIKPVPSVNGIFGAAELKSALRAPRPKAPRARLVNIEQTSNRGGGAIWPLETLREVSALARENGLRIHMDGARLLNAVVASGEKAADYAQGCDSVWLDLSKGLGCPIGGVLAGSSAFIEDAWIWKYRFGGGMRQSGFLAAAGLYALDYNVDRLAEDHENARLFAELVSDIPGIELEFNEIATNLVFLKLRTPGLTATRVAQELEARGVRIGVESDTSFRAVTHLDVTKSDVNDAASALRDVLDALA